MSRFLYIFTLLIIIGKYLQKLLSFTPVLFSRGTFSFSFSSGWGYFFKSTQKCTNFKKVFTYFFGHTKIERNKTIVVGTSEIKGIFLSSLLSVTIKPLLLIFCLFFNIAFFSSNAPTQSVARGQNTDSNRKSNKAFKNVQKNNKALIPLITYTRIHTRKSQKCAKENRA